MLDYVRMIGMPRPSTLTTELKKIVSSLAVRVLDLSSSALPYDEWLSHSTSRPVTSVLSHSHLGYSHAFLIHLPPFLCSRS